MGNIQQISYIPQTKHHLPFGLMLLHLGNVTIICNLREYIAVIHSPDETAWVIPLGYAFRLMLFYLKQYIMVTFSIQNSNGECCSA